MIQLLLLLAIQKVRKIMPVLRLCYSATFRVGAPPEKSVRLECIYCRCGSFTAFEITDYKSMGHQSGRPACIAVFSFLGGNPVLRNVNSVTCGACCVHTFQERDRSCTLIMIVPWVLPVIPEAWVVLSCL